MRLFEAAGIECCVAQSFAKNMGLYGERTGCLHVVCASATAAEHVRSQVRRRGVARARAGSPPQGADERVARAPALPAAHSSNGWSAA